MLDFGSRKNIIASVILIAAIAGVIIFAVRGRGAGQSPSSLVLPVPFSPQAPNNNWSRNEDCEETSVTMANAFLTGTTEDKLPPEAAQQAINNLRTWEQANLGYNANTGAEATTKMAEGAFGLKVQRINDYSEQDLKNALAGGHPVLLPINARLLNNPKYLDNGPLYHMVVARGYNGKGFIVNDPGTDSGDGNVYPFATLKNAGADWNQAAKSLEPGTKVALVLSK